MQDRSALSSIGAATLVARIFGVLSGIGGLTHGIGEVLQGNRVPDGIIINSWAQGPIATNMGGEPGMTIVPNLLITGVLNIVVSVSLIVWSAAFVQRKRGGLIQLLLAIGTLLFGGGFGPPIIGTLASVAGMGIHAPYTWWRAHFPTGLRRFLAWLWPWIFGVTVINGVFLVIGSLILVYGFGLNNPDLFVGSFFFSVVSLLLTLFTGVAYDLERAGA